VHWLSEIEPESELSSAAAAVLNALRSHGASFFVELVSDSGLLRTQVEAALGELVSQGLVTADSFAGLRALIAPAELKARSLRRGGVRAALQGLEGAGRWALVRSRARAEDSGGEPGARLEFLARTLLRRYGVLFRALLDREPRLPPWRELVYVLRRLEARDEVQGGRFVSGFAGEQFALPEAAAALRRQREDRDQALVVVSATDPLNLSGILLPGERVPAIMGHRLLLQGGVVVASLVAREVKYREQPDPGSALEWRRRLLRGPAVETGVTVQHTA
jgi:ATP-dependent Lhr-like helicase